MLHLPLEQIADAARNEVPKLHTRSALDAWLADRRTVRFREVLRHSPEHFDLWKEIEGLIAAAVAWAADDTPPGPTEGNTTDG